MSYIRTPEIREKCRIAHLGQTCSEEHKANLRIKMSGSLNPFFGKKHTQETKKKIAQTRIERGIKTNWSGKGNNPIFFGEDNPSKRPEVRKLLSEQKRGTNNPNWREGVSTESALIRHSAEYRNWRKEVFTRDNYTCQECGVRNGEGSNVMLNADHIKPFAYHPELRFELSNGKTLCVDCHKKTGTYGFHK